MSGYVFILGNCFTCGKPFTFHPHLVPSVPIDPQTNRPLDVNEHGKEQPIEPGARARAVREPLCRDCISLVNIRRVERGEEPIYVSPNAYEAIEAGQL